MSRFLMFLLAFLVPAGLVAQVPDWHREVLVRANYGDKQDEYGYPGVEKEQEIGPVSAFYVGDKNIYIEDCYQGNIKEYDLSGRFLRAITLERPRPRKVPRNVNNTYITMAPHDISDTLERPRPLMKGPNDISDLLVYNGVIYLLCVGQANVYVRTYDLDTGKKIETINIYNPEIEAPPTYGAASFALGQPGTIFISDAISGVSIPIIRDGKDVPAAEHTQGIPGRIFGPRRVIFHEETEQEELVDSAGSFVRNLPVGKMISTDLDASSKNGEYLLRRNSTSKMDFTISTWDGRDIGRVVWQPEKPWWDDPICDLIQVGPDGAFYHVYPDNDCLYVYRWSK